MKINEKNLISFATSKTPVDREGWLCKRGEVNKSLQKRWFLLKGNLLFYFEKRDDKEPVGVIILEGCTIELAEDEDAFAFKLVFHGAGNRTYILCANSHQDMEEWMKAIASASYDYMKLMVAELQRQLNEITEMEKQAKSDMQNRLRAGGLPMNRSDSCLCSRADSSVRIQRFNPFDKSTLLNNTDFSQMGKPYETQTPPRMTTAVSEDDLVKYNIHSIKANRQKFLFLEMHEYYGQIFRRVFEEIKRKRHQNVEEKLIDFE